MEQLTQKRVDELVATPVEKTKRYRDDGQVGLFLWLRPPNQGRPAYVWQRSKLWESIGDPLSMSLQDARDEAGLLNWRLGNDKLDPRLMAKRGNITIGHLMQRWWKGHVRGLKPKTQEGYKSYVKALTDRYGRVRWRAIRAEDLQMLKYGYLERPYMFNRMMAVLKAAWAWGQEVGMIDSQVACPANTVQLYEEKKRDRYLDSAELERLLDEVSKLERKDAANAIYLLIFTGARRSEILDLRWEEIDWEGSVAVLRDSKTGPGKAVYLNADAIQLLEWMRPTYGRSEGPVFPGLTTLSYWWKKAAKRAGLSGVRLHDLRHTFASVGLKSGLSLEEISKLLGHSDLRVTQRYAHMNNKQLLKAVDTVGTAIRSK